MTRPFELVIAELAVEQHRRAGEKPCARCVEQLRRTAARYRHLNRKDAA